MEKSVLEMTIMDDKFMSTFFYQEPERLAFVLRKILNNPTLIVKQSELQYFVAGVRRTLKLDALVVDDTGKQYNIEFQNDNRGAIPKRARYHISMMDAQSLEENQGFDELPETYSIFITRNDYFGKGAPIYWFDRIDETNGLKLGDGTHILYVNGRYQQDDDIGHLIHDLQCAKPEQMYYDILAERARYLKTPTANGRWNMEDEFWKIQHEREKRIGNEKFQEGLLEGEQRGIQKGEQRGLQKGRQDTLKDLVARGFLTREQVNALG